MFFNVQRGALWRAFMLTNFFMREHIQNHTKDEMDYEKKQSFAYTQDIQSGTKQYIQSRKIGLKSWQG